MDEKKDWQTLQAVMNNPNIQWATDFLSKEGISSAHLNAVRLFEHSCK